MLKPPKDYRIPGFYVYVDWTCEEIPRPFYVGKGQKNRFFYVTRNNVHTNICEKYGIKRVIVAISDDEDLTLNEEKRLVEVHKTYFYGGEGYWGANFTRGGEKVPSLSHEACARIGKANSQRVWADESRQKVSLSKLGVKQSKEHVIAKGIANKGKKRTEKQCQRMREAWETRVVSEETGLKKSRFVQKCSLDGEVLETFPSIKYANESVGGKYSTFYPKMKKGKPYMGFLWKLIEKKKQNE